MTVKELLELLARARPEDDVYLVDGEGTFRPIDSVAVTWTEDDGWTVELRAAAVETE